MIADDRKPVPLNVERKTMKLKNFLNGAKI